MHIKGQARVDPKRAIFRASMLLRDSVVAKEVRAKLLNALEHVAEPQKVEVIEEEKSILNHAAEQSLAPQQS